MILKINILGTDYTIERREYKADPLFEKMECDGYCDGMLKLIVVCIFQTHPLYEEDSDNRCELAEKETLRHEIVHAFFNESGLKGSSLQYGGGWAKNEEMVDWIAIQFPKLLQAFKDADCM